MTKYRVTLTQKQDLTYELEAKDETEAQTEVETADIETLDGWEIHMETYGASVTNVEVMD